MKLTKLNQLIENGEVIKGHWQLDDNHDLLYISDGPDEEVKCTGSLIAAEPDALVFSVTEKQKDQKIVTSIVKLSGTWKLNPKNQITFAVQKGMVKSDTLTFTGTWDLDDNHEIIYIYERTVLKTKTKETQSIVFKGHWDITDKNCLTYCVGGDSDNAFKFRGTFQTKSILAKKGEIRYQVGVEVDGKRKNKTITLFGKWIVSRDLWLDFEIEYDEGKRKSISFGGTYSLNDSTDITVDLKSESGKPLGIEVVLTKDIFGKDGQAFVRLQKTLEESSVEAGVKFVW